MIKGIQITRSANPALVRSFWLLDDETQQVRCLCSNDEQYAEDQVIAFSDLDQAVAFETKHTLAHLIESETPVYPKTIETYNRWVSRMM